MSLPKPDTCRRYDICPEACATKVEFAGRAGSFTRSEIESLLPPVEALGRRHAGYGVQPKDFDPVGAALLWTLEQGHAPAFTPDIRDAWALAYGTLAKVMIDAASETDVVPVGRVATASA